MDENHGVDLTGLTSEQVRNLAVDAAREDEARKTEARHKLEAELRSIITERGFDPKSFLKSPRKVRKAATREGEGS